MPIKWLECKVHYNPEALPSKRYDCSFTDFYGRNIQLKTGEDQLYTDYVGPPGAPYITRGRLRVELHDLYKEQAVIILPCRGSHGETSAYVLPSAIEFTPPEKKKTVCLLRRRK